MAGAVEGYYASLTPMPYEYSAGTLPDELLVIGKAFVKRKKEFCPEIKISIAPAFRFQDAINFDRRMLNLDPQPEEMILSDQKRIIVDSFARYKIIDPLKFFQTVRNEATFSDRFGRILNASVRGVIAQYPLRTLLSI